MRKIFKKKKFQQKEFFQTKFQRFSKNFFIYGVFDGLFLASTMFIET